MSIIGKNLKSIMGKFWSIIDLGLMCCPEYLYIRRFTVYYDSSDKALAV